MVAGLMRILVRRNEIERLRQMASDIKRTYIWVVWALGFPSNILCVVTVLSMRGPSPATFLVSTLAVTDGLAISAKLLAHQFGQWQVYMGTVGCKSNFWAIFLSSLANWTLVLICGERYVAVCFPLKKVYVVTRRRCQVTVLALALTLLIFFASVYYVMRDADSTGYYCGTYNKYLAFWTTGWYWINTLISLFLPFLCIVLLTALIVYGLMRSRRERRGILGKTADVRQHLMDGSNNKNRRGTNQRLLKEAEAVERSITAMLILAAAIFLLLALPTCIYLLAYKQPRYGESRDPLLEARWALFDQIQFVLIDSSHAVNFFLYFLSAQRFRRQLYHVIRCRRLPGRESQSRTLEMTNITHP
ncbi:thyrotropin-releasing hormone receptor [Plakobranchus ocellatus]|uniref:Thyrotropin-releasing hormone receptor n=1 Tax=Plakobranchus ocellatus TaxID=259542 RepID=A0AAV4CX06_9GAST|nr:thyrotropin-releasing hormone receptor [Plakobranchus ocellatus]